MTGGMRSRLPRRGSVALFALLVAVAGSIDPAHADKVGVAAAVNPDAFSSLSGSPQTELNIGKSIFFNERINTTGKGLVQVLLVDGSTFTVGPGSDLVIDKFVYDPNKKSGEVVASFSKGVMRFVGGKISKNEGGVVVNTPSGALAIRGGMFQTNGKVYSFLFGENMTLTGKNGQTYTVFQPGNSIDVSGTVPTVRATTQGDINSVMAQLTNGNTGGTNTTNTQGPAQQKLVETVSLQDLITEATDTQINGDLNNQEQQDQTQTTDTTTGTPTTPTGTPTPPTGTPTPPTDNTTPVNARVLSPANSYFAYGTQFLDPKGILGGDSRPEVNADDFIQTFNLGPDRFQATVTGLVDGSNDFQPATIDFPATLQCQDGVCPINLPDNATISQTGQTTTYAGLAVFKPNFFAYDVVAATNPDSNDHPDRLLVFGGAGYNFAPASGKIYSFNLTPDTVESGAFGPFASRQSSPVLLPGATAFPTGVFYSDGGNGFISPLVLLEKNGGSEDLSHAVWLQTNFFVGSGNNKGSSFINIALGEWSAEGGITGFRRGGSIVLGPNEAPPQTYSFSGDIASLAGPNSQGMLSSFMGSANPNIVIGADSTGTHNIFRDTPLNPTEDNNTLQNQLGATYHVGVGSGPIEPIVGQDSATLHGFAAGFAQQPGGGAPHILGNVSPGDVTLSLDAARNTLTASFKVGDGVLQNPLYNLAFGDVGRSAFVDNGTFAAVEAQSGSSVSEQYLKGSQINTFTDNHPVIQGFIVSADAIQANEILFPSNGEQKRAFCQSCDYIKWGAWGAQVASLDHTGHATTSDVELGWWIAGNVVPETEMPKTGSATYLGDAIGNVVNSGQQYTATGDMRMGWNFATRSGALTISNFDNRSFSGVMLAPGTAQFSGALVGSNLVGRANGAFVGSPGPGLTPQGVIGNFGVAGANYQANGIFGGTHVGN